MGTVTGATDGPGIVATMRHMNTQTPETLDQYMERRTAVRAELTADEGSVEDFIREALGVQPIAPPLRTMLYSEGFILKRQAG